MRVAVRKRKPNSARPRSSQSFDQGDPRLAESCLNLGDAVTARGRPSEAEALYRRALAVQEKSKGNNQSDTYQSLISLATVLKEKGRFIEAEAMAQRALAVAENHGREGYDVAYALTLLATAYSGQSRYDEAEQRVSTGLVPVGKDAQTRVSRCFLLLE